MRAPGAGGAERATRHVEERVAVGRAVVVAEDDAVGRVEAGEVVVVGAAATEPGEHLRDRSTTINKKGGACGATRELPVGQQVDSDRS